MSIERQEKRGTLLDDTHAGVSVPMNVPRVSFGLSKPAFQIKVVLGQVQVVAPCEQARREAAQHAAQVLAEWRGSGCEATLQRLEVRLAFCCGTAGGRECRGDRTHVCNLCANSLLRCGDPGQTFINARAELF